MWRSQAWLLHRWPFIWEFARNKSRPCLSLREEDRTMALHLGGFPSRAGPACPAVVMTFGAPSFLRDHPLIQVNLDQETRDSILTSLHKGIPLGSPLIEAFLFTDTSAVGWGAHMAERTASGRWSEAMKDLHINVLEFGLVSNVAIMCDNVSAIAYLRNQGGTRSQQMCRMAIDTCEWAE